MNLGRFLDTYCIFPSNLAQPTEIYKSGFHFCSNCQKDGIIPKFSNTWCDTWLLADNNWLDCSFCCLYHVILFCNSTSIANKLNILNKWTTHGGKINDKDQIYLDMRWECFCEAPFQLSISSSSSVLWGVEENEVNGKLPRVSLQKSKLSWPSATKSWCFVCHPQSDSSSMTIINLNK